MKKTHLTIVCCLLSFGLAAGAAAQDIDEVMTKVIAGNGGEENLRALTSVQMIGTINFAQWKREFPMRAYGTDHAFRQEIVGVQTRAYDGETGWHVGGYKKDGSATARIMAGDEALATKRGVGLTTLFLDFEQRGVTLTLHGTEEEDGKKLYVVEYSYPDGVGGYMMKYDAETGLPKWMDFGGARMEYLDFRPVAGVMFPFRLDVYNAQGQLETTLQYEKIVVNENLAQSLFTMPEELKKAAINGAMECPLSAAANAADKGGQQ